MQSHQHDTLNDITVSGRTDLTKRVYLQVKDLFFIESLDCVTGPRLLGENQGADLEQARLFIQLAGKYAACLNASGGIPDRISAVALACKKTCDRELCESWEAVNAR